MRAYKFRSDTQVAFALDIIFNRRLRCSDWTRLNDPVEGVFSYSYRHGDDGAVIQSRIEAIKAGKTGLKVCSLSKTLDSHLLWAHYANGFSGLAIEVELPEPDADDRIRKVRYRDVLSTCRRLLEIRMSSHGRSSPQSTTRGATSKRCG